jgi:hypothetical protein
MILNLSHVCNLLYTLHRLHDLSGIGIKTCVNNRLVILTTIVVESHVGPEDKGVTTHTPTQLGHC